MNKKSFSLNPTYITCCHLHGPLYCATSSSVHFHFLDVYFLSLLLLGISQEISCKPKLPLEDILNSFQTTLDPVTGFNVDFKAYANLNLVKMDDLLNILRDATKTVIMVIPTISMKIIFTAHFRAGVRLRWQW